MAQKYMFPKPIKKNTQPQSNTQTLKQENEQTNFKQKTKKPLSRVKRWLKKNLAKCLAKTIIVLAKILVGACIWFVLAELAPELRKALPHFYQLIDLLVKMLDKLAEFVITRYGQGLF